MTNLASLTVQFHPLHPNISMHILHTILFTFPKVLTGRICRYISTPGGGIQSPLSAPFPLPPPLVRTVFFTSCLTPNVLLDRGSLLMRSVVY